MSNICDNLVIEHPNHSATQWMPKHVAMYVAHIEFGHSLRRIAKQFSVHPSTVSRSVRKVESRRDDPMVDQFMADIGKAVSRGDERFQGKNEMNVQLRVPIPAIPHPQSDGQILSVLRRLAEGNTVLALAKGLEIAVIIREMPDGQMEKLATVDRTTVMSMTMQDWIISDDPNGKIVRYKIATLGRAKLRDLLEQVEGRDPVLQVDSKRQHRMRYGVAESPLLSMARRFTKSGHKFLDADLVAVGEQLREDYEISRINAPKSIDWGLVISTGIYPDGISDAATLRLARALVDLGPGLADVALNCCCKLEGLEVTEQKMGWSARSGKIVLRIALQRLKRHFEDQGVNNLLVG